MGTISSFWKKIIKGFEVTGIYPFNRNIFTDVEYAPSFVTDRPSPSLLFTNRVTRSVQVNTKPERFQYGPSLRGPCVKVRDSYLLVRTE